MLKEVVAEMITLWILLLAVLPGLLVNAVVVFEQRPGTTCGVKGGVAHLVWDYDDTTSPVNIIRWYYGTVAGISMGKYVTGTEAFDAYGTYQGNLKFRKTSSARFKSAILTLSGLQDADEGNYTTRFQAAPDTYDVSILEVAEASGLGTWEVCANGICEDILGSLTLRASGNVKVKFTKNVTLTCDMDIDLTLSDGSSCQMEVGAQDSLTAECDLGDADSLVGTGPLSIHLSFGKNGQVFLNDTDTIANITVISGGQSPSPAQAAAIAFGVIFIIVGIILVAVVLFKGNKKAGLKLADKVCVGVGVGLCVIGCILVVVFVAALAYLTSAEIAGACVAVCVVTVVILIVIVVVWYKMKVM